MIKMDKEYENYIIHNKKTYYQTSDTVKSNFFRSSFEDYINEGIIISFPFLNVRLTTVCQATEIPKETYFKRCGVIPYIEYDNQKYFCLGVDKQFGTLTDFGGQAQKGEFFCQTASRELFEETLGVINISSDDLYKYSKAVYSANAIILFVQLKVDTLNKMIEEFKFRYFQSHHSENTDMIWVPETAFYSMIKTGRNYRTFNNTYPQIYRAVTDVLKNVCDINYLI